ncbi:uncharacterized protein AB9W97_008623 isoform 1-T2 [Spinachia spinachia]
MDGTRTSLGLFLLLSRLTLGLTGEGRSLLTAKPTDNSSTPTGPATPPPPGCLMDTEMGLIAVGMAAALIVCLLGASGVLACQLCLIQRRVYAPRSPRSNLDLVSGAGYWDLERRGAGGLVGPCDSSVVLEEVRGAEDGEEERRGREGEEAPEERVSLMQRSASPDSCLVIPRDLEDMPLVV